jgi:tetratricopeptide (TPR) repeat protein
MKDYIMIKTRTTGRHNYEEKLAIVHFDVGCHKYEHGAYNTAVKEFSQAIRRNKNMYFAYINRGESYRALGKPELALKDFEKVIDMMPAYKVPTILYYFRALAYYDMNDLFNAFSNMDFVKSRLKTERKAGIIKNNDFINEHLNTHYAWTKKPNLKNILKR